MRSITTTTAVEWTNPASERPANRTVLSDFWKRTPQHDDCHAGSLGEGLSSVLELPVCGMAQELEIE